MNFPNRAATHRRSPSRPRQNISSHTGNSMNFTNVPISRFSLFPIVHLALPLRMLTKYRHTAAFFSLPACPPPPQHRRCLSALSGPICDQTRTCLARARHPSTVRDSMRRKVIVGKNAAPSMRSPDRMRIDGLRFFDMAVECVHLTVDGRLLVMCMLRTFANKGWKSFA
jgi:hypothetical protein